MDYLTEIHKFASVGGRHVSGELLPLVYDELRNMASVEMRGEGPRQTLQATALVHEAWLRLSKDQEREWNDKEHFFRAAAQVMRRVLVDRAHAKGRLKRGSGVEPVDISDVEAEEATPDDQILLVDEALTQLETEDPDSARVVSLKFFGGLTNKEIAVMDGVSERTVERHWAFARGLLYQKILHLAG